MPTDVLVAELAEQVGGIMAAAIERVASASRDLDESAKWRATLDELRGLSRGIDVYGVVPQAALPPKNDDDVGPGEAAVAIVEAIGTILNDATVESSSGDTVLYRIDVEATEGAPPGVRDPGQVVRGPRDSRRGAHAGRRPRRAHPALWPRAPPRDPL